MSELNKFRFEVSLFKCRPGKSISRLKRFMSGLKKSMSEMNLVHLELEIVQVRA